VEYSTERLLYTNFVIKIETYSLQKPNIASPESSLAVVGFQRYKNSISQGSYIKLSCY
jgi:hypothetical protein